MFIADVSEVRSVHDYKVTIQELPENQKTYTVDKTGLNYSVAGFKMTLKRKVSHYIITSGTSPAACSSWPPGSASSFPPTLCPGG